MRENFHCQQHWSALFHWPCLEFREQVWLVRRDSIASKVMQSCFGKTLYPIHCGHGLLTVSRHSYIWGLLVEICCYSLIE
ncbi:hypothetical protein MPTK1_6g15020 [Marchantia polymorpha subsp. ruderalis]|uniref:Uncharacterized protein n=2 Tax=Marchantia polymorpha TaxID=3197 RepID=A0AAF6BS68_MARPO|nr:hypothetical protein MARPO_0056s0012 [Marchantia polymorpha]BBN14852.1 hypothetical protein Mp_6g15020 [Marchantia polymorpha subsp. ruderalis]|eukprot:PTQ37533.1 hypothetical protein MARPO_0056s0012 [Marchantia polymorpha]